MRASLVTRHSGSINTAPTRLLLLLVILAASWSADALAVGAATQLLAAAQRGDEARVLQLKTEFDSKPKPARGDKKTARALNEEALELLRSGDFPTAIERLTAASKADSGDAEVLGNLGYAYLMIQRFSDAKTALERALELAPTRTATWASLGETYAGLGDEPAAIAALRLAYQFSRNREKTIAYFTLLIEKPDAPPMLISAAKEARAAPDLPAGERRGTVAEEARQLSQSLSSPPVTRGIEPAQRNASETRDRSTVTADPVAGDREPTVLLSNTQGHVSPAPGMIKTTIPSSHDPVEAWPQASTKREGRAAGHSSQREDAGVGVAGLATTSSQWVTFALAACLLVALTYIATNHLLRRQLPAAGRTALPQGGHISPTEKATVPQALAIVEESAMQSGSAMRRAVVGDSGAPRPINVGSPMRTLGNILWHFPFFGFVNAIGVYLLGFILTATVIAAPIGLGLMEFGKFLFAPFGHAMVSKSDLGVKQNQVWKAYSTIVMVIYFPFGLILALLAVLQVVGLFITIIGIPVALVVAKSLGTYVNPVNKKCVHSAVVDELEGREAQAQLNKHLGWSVQPKPNPAIDTEAA